MSQAVQKSPSKEKTMPKASLGHNHATSIEELKKSRTSELVIALCGFIGSGVTSVGETITRSFRNYGYESKNIKISDFIRLAYSLEKSSRKTFGDVLQLQQRGNELRKKYNNAYLAELAILEIAKDRPQPARETSLPIHRRHVTIIDSLKRPEEYEILKLVYGSMFYMVGVICPLDIRKLRLSTALLDKTEMNACLEYDREESNINGQNTVNALACSDFFVDNSGDTINYHNLQIQRFTELVLGIPTHTPTNDEYGMYCAYAASLRSGCLSRQVGAAIMKDGNIIATGRNDVPKQNGGLYTEDDSEDYRCFKKYGQCCQSDTKKFDFITECKKIIKDAKIGDEGKEDTIAENIRQMPMLKSLVEYTRSVHAEMDAITSIAKQGGPSLQDSTLYCTTFPCHHCAKLILAAGIREVIYIEPYDKSLSYEMYSHSIVVDNSNTYYPERLHMRYFYGVAPKCYVQLFKYTTRKGPDGRIIKSDTPSPMPHNPIPLGNFEINEIMVTKMWEDYLRGLINPTQKES